MDLKGSKSVNKGLTYSEDLDFQERYCAIWKAGWGLRTDADMAAELKMDLSSFRPQMNSPWFKKWRAKEIQDFIKKYNLKTAVRFQNPTGFFNLMQRLEPNMTTRETWYWWSIYDTYKRWQHEKNKKKNRDIKESDYKKKYKPEVTHIYNVR